jgi:hypothetical protein
MLPLGPPTGPAVKDGERARKDTQKRPAFPAKAHGLREQQPNCDGPDAVTPGAPATSAHGYATDRRAPSNGTGIQRNGKVNPRRGPDDKQEAAPRVPSCPVVFPHFPPHLFGFAPPSEYPSLFTPASPPPPTLHLRVAGEGTGRGTRDRELDPRPSLSSPELVAQAEEGAPESGSGARGADVSFSRGVSGGVGA